MHILKVYSDLETPVSLFLRLRKRGEPAFLLESAEQGVSFGRYSFIGIGKKDELLLTPDGKLTNTQREIEIKDGKTPLSYMEDFLKENGNLSIYDSELPPFSGGALGYVSYEYISYIENIPLRNSEFNIFHFVIPLHLIIFDHVKNQLYIISESPEEIMKKIHDKGAEPTPKKAFFTQPISNFSKEKFCTTIKRAKEYIVEGDIFQVVISQAFKFKTDIDPFSIYRALRMINPSPYMFYLNFGESTILGSSPEVMVKSTKNKAILKPIAGTRKRGATLEEDLVMEKELLSSEKERAEHTMLVDLGRNDLGKVSKIGSVKLEETMVLEKYSHVMHLVSLISGELPKEKSVIDLFEATFPAGTVTGAPKIRAMEIIEELEPTPRGPYAGAVLYFSYPDNDGYVNMDSGIMIRSFFFRGKEGYIQAGAGIVYDSIAENEYIETLNKLKALFQSLEIARDIEGGVL